MKYPISTGQVVEELGAAESKLSDLVRTKKIQSPPVVAGRRLWSEAHVEEAREAIRLEDARRQALANEEVNRGV